MKSLASEPGLIVLLIKKIIQFCIYTKLYLTCMVFLSVTQLKIRWLKKIMLYVKNNIILLKIMNEVNLEGNTFKTKKY